MRTSQYLLATFKETPADAELISHQLMIRAGMIRRLGAGLYSWLPLGLRVLKKVENIIREEMDKSGALEVAMPNTQPAELWQESGRWEHYGPELLRIKDRNQRDFCIGPTHEEVITDIMRREIQSYKQLPLNFYQIGTKFRDEIRPRFGIMRAREFMMKDSYSFHIDKTSLNETYEIMYQTYCNIFQRLGLDFRPVLADTGSIGGNFSHEFQVLADSGEDTIAISDSSDYAANVELAEAIAPNTKRPAATATMSLIDTPTQQSITDVCAHLHCEPAQTVKILIVKGSEQPLVALVIRGDHELNPIKAEKIPGVAAPFSFAEDKEIVMTLGCKPGFLGPIGLKIPVIVDRSAAQCANFICGANQNGKHYQNVNWGRDLAEPQVADLRKVVTDDQSPDGKGKLILRRGIEVGHIFQLGKKYSDAMQATVLNEQGQRVAMEMGCYGIGVSRIVAAAIEQNHDDKGIRWPMAMAPFQIALVPINLHKSPRLREACETAYQTLIKAGFSVLFDDRNERPGVMFADMDLIGIPHRIVMSDRGLEAGTVEYKARTADAADNISLEDVIAKIKSELSLKQTA